MKHTKRFWAFALALTMLLPLISIPVLAADSEPVYADKGSLLWSNDFEKATTPSDVLSGTLSSTGEIRDVGGTHGKVYYHSNVPATTHAEGEYFIRWSQNTWNTATVKKDDYSDTYSGSVSRNGNTYYFKNAFLNTDSLENTVSLYTDEACEQPLNDITINGTVYGNFYLCNAQLRNANQGQTNIAVPNNVSLKDKNIKTTTKDVSLVFVADYYFSSDFTGGMDVRIHTQAGDFHFANIYANGTGMAIGLQENLRLYGANVKSYTVTFEKETWVTVGVAINPTTGKLHLYCNGDLVGYGTMTSGTFSSITGGNGWNLGHVRRGSAVSAYAGYYMIDNLAIYSGDYDEWTTDAIYRRAFDTTVGYATLIDYVNGTASLGNTYAGSTISGHWAADWTQGKTDTSLSYPNGGNVDRNLRIKDIPEISYKDYDSVVFEADYYLPTDANYHFQMQFYNMKADWYGSDETMATDSRLAEQAQLTWNQITNIKVTGGKITSITAGNTYDSSTTVKTYDYDVPTGQWVTISTILDLDSGWIELWFNGQIVAEWQMNYSGLKNGVGGYAKNITIPAGTGGWILAKLSNKKTDSEFANGYSGDILIDNVSVYEGTKPHMYVESFEPVEFNSDDFESYTVGNSITLKDSYNVNYNSEILAYNKILADANGNKFVRVPVVYDGSQSISTAGYTNNDKTLTINHSKITANDEFMVMDVSYRPHGNETDVAETIELQLRNFKFDLKVADGATMKPKNGTASAVTSDVSQKNGIYCTLFFINLNTGALTFGVHTAETTGAAGLVQDQWNNIRYILNLKNATATLLVNGEVYATITDMTLTGSDWASCTKGSNLTIPAGNVIISKVNKNTSAFKTTQDADETYSNVNYLDIDNVNISTKKGSEIVKSFDPTAYAGIVSTESKASIRLTAPTGLRFATLVNEDMLDDLYDLIGDSLLSVKFGTLIVPEDYLTDTDFTVEALEAAGKKYLDVEATYGAYYSVDTDETTTHFVGSIVNIKNGNEARAFAGIGYVKATLMTGAEYYFYSDSAYVTNVQQTAQKVIDTTDTSGYTAASKKALDAYANGTSLNDIIANDMKGLNVLALGDSLFAGTDKGTAGCDRESQWVNLLGNNHDWTLTNLGIGGMTVSYTDKNYTTSGQKASMYDWLFNGYNDYRWGSSYNTTAKLTYPNVSTTYNYYYQCGDFTGKTADDVDLIILEGGCNDYGYEIAAPLGTITSDDPSTFLGAWNCITEKLLETYPNAKIVFITTWYLNPQSRSDNLTSIEYSTSINKLYDQVYASNDRVYMIDAGNPSVSGVDMLDSAWRNEYSNDSYHLKNNGMAIMASNMLPRLWEIWINANN